LTTGVFTVVAASGVDGAFGLAAGIGLAAGVGLASGVGLTDGVTAAAGNGSAKLNGVTEGDGDGFEVIWILLVSTIDLLPLACAKAGNETVQTMPSRINIFDSINLKVLVLYLGSC
jgi:hypothetical protein